VELDDARPLRPQRRGADDAERAGSDVRGEAVFQVSSIGTLD
jgi:hypothetical protein